MSMIGTISYLLTVWGLVCHLIFGKPIAHRIRKLEKKERRLMAELKAIKTSFVPGNSQFSHAAWILLCISNGTCRVAARGFKRQQIEGIRTEYERRSVNAHSLYRLCFDAVGFFGAEGTFEPLGALCKEQWALLKLDRAKFVSDSVPVAEVEVV